MSKEKNEENTLNKMKAPRNEIAAEPPTYEETMTDKEQEASQHTNPEPAPYVKFPHAINRHTAKNNKINDQFPGNKTLTYFNANKNDEKH